MDSFDNSVLYLIRNALAVAAVAVLALGGCASNMSSGMTDDGSSASNVPSYAPGTYEPPYQVGAPPEEKEQPATQEGGTEQKYEYRGGRDPLTGRAKTQM